MNDLFKEIFAVAALVGRALVVLQQQIAAMVEKGRATTSTACGNSRAPGPPLLEKK